MQSVQKQSPEYQPALESGEAGVAKKIESQDLGVYVESSAEHAPSPGQDQTTKFSDTTQPLPQVPVPPKPSVSEVVSRIRSRLFSGMDVSQLSKQAMVDHLLVKHNFDVQLAYDLVEFLKLELADQTKTS